jgi:chorismate mutase
MTMSETPSISQSLESVRAAIDAVDDRLLALIQERAALASEVAAAKGAIEGSPLRPAREVQTLRRLLAQAGGVEPALIVEIWRALVADNTRRQKCVEVFTGGATDSVRLFDLARRHFGGSARITRAEDARVALARMAETPAAAAVLPFPGKSGAGGWWPILAERRFHEACLIAALPLREEGEPEAAVITRGVPLEPTGDRDIMFAIAFDPHHKLVRGLNEAALPGKEAARANATVLIQFEGYVAPNDPRLAIVARAGLDGLRVMGCYARV